MKFTQSLFIIAIAFIASAVATPVLEARDIGEPINDADIEFIIDRYLQWTPSRKIAFMV